MDVDMNDAPAEAADAIVVEDAPDVAASPNAGGEDSPGSLVHQGTIIDADIAVAEPPPVAPPAFADEAIAPEDDAVVAPASPQSDENLDDIDGDTASEASEDDRAGSGEGASGPADGTVGDAEDVEEDAEEEEGVRGEAGPTAEIDIDDALADLTLAQRQELVELAKTFQGTISEEDLPTLAAKYELDPPQVAAVVASMWAKHLDRPLTARKKKRELKPNSRYDQDSIANAEAAEEEEEEEQVEAEVTPMDEDQHTPRGTKHLDDDDEDVSYDEKTGISAEVRVQVTCGDMRGTAVLPAGYKKQQEYVLHSDGKKVPPSQFERDAGKGSCKNWKNSVMVVMPDGSEGRTFRVWMESNGYFPVGTKWDESVVNAARALMGRRKKVNHGDKSSHAVKTQPAAKKPKPAPAQAAKKVEKAAPSVEKVAEKAPVEKSIFEAQLENLLDDDGGLRLVEKMPNFVWLMRNAMKNAERSLVVSVIHRTNDRRCAEAFVKSDGIKVLHEWCAQAKESNKSSLVLKMLKTFRRLPMTVTALSSTGLGNFVNKLRKYKPPGKDNDDLTKQVIEEAERVKLKWVSVVRAESEAADARAKKESDESSKQKAAANAANAAHKRPLVPQTAEEAAKRRKVEPTGPAAGASTPSQGSKETSTGMINKAPAAKVPTATKVGVPKPTTTIARATVTTIARPTTSSVTSFGGVNVRGVAAYRKDPTAGKLSSAGSGSKTSSGGVGSVLKSREPEKKKEFFTKSNYAKKKSSKLQKLQSAGKQARVGIGWKADAELEAVKFFFKDDFIVADKSADPAEERRRAAQERRDAARQKEKEEEEDVEPEDEDERAAIAKARERQQKEKAAEQRAANLTRVRRLNEMKATGRWVQPRRIEYPPGWDIHPGRDSGERGRLQSRWKGEFEVKYRSPDQIPESPREAPHGSQGSSVDPPTMIEVSTKPPPKAPPSHAGPMSGGGGFNNVQQSSTAFNPPLPGGPPPPGTNQLQSMLQQFGNQGVNQGVNQGGNPGGNPGGQGTGGIDQSALQALLQSVQSGALKVQGGPGNGGGLNGGGMNGGGPPPLPPTSFGAPPPQHAPMGPGMGARAYNQGAMPPGLGGGGMGGGPGPSIGGSVNNGGIIPGQGQGHTHEAWRPLADGGQKGPMPGGNGMCAFFNTPKGCYHGDNCRFRHERGAAPPPPGAYPNRRF